MRAAENLGRFNQRNLCRHFLTLSHSPSPTPLHNKRFLIESALSDTTNPTSSDDALPGLREPHRVQS